jgi:hypothetical protein
MKSNFIKKAAAPKKSFHSQKSLLICLAILSYYLSACGGLQTVTQIDCTTQDSSAFVIDGNLGEWQHPLLSPAALTNIQYKASNDAQNLYICIRIPDKGIQQRVMGLGLSIYIDTLAKQKEKRGVGYPLALSNEQLEKISFQAYQENKGIDDRALDQAYAAICQEFELLGFVEENINEKIRVSNLASKDIKTAMGFDHVSAMICEFKMPLSLLFERKLKYNETLSIGIKVNNPEANADNDPGLFSDSGNPITGSNQQGNPMNPGMNGQPRVNRLPTRSNNNSINGVWTKIQLCQP